MGDHEYASGGASWNPAFRPDSHHEHVPNQAEPPAIVPEESWNAAEREAHAQPRPAEVEAQLPLTEETTDQPQEAIINHRDLPDYVSPNHEHQTNPVQDADIQGLDTDASRHAASLDSEEPPPAEFAQTVPESSESVSDIASEYNAPPVVAVSAPHETDQEIEQAIDPESKQEVEQEIEQESKPEQHPVPEDDQHTNQHADQHLEAHDVDQRAETPVLIPEPSRDLSALDDQANLQESQETLIPEQDLTTIAEDAEADGQIQGYEYEYQGELTVADEAVHESVKASLLDEEVMPTAEVLPTPPQNPSAVIEAAFQEAAAKAIEQDAAADFPSDTFGWSEQEADDTFDALGIQSQSEQQHQAEESRDTQQHSDNAFWDEAGGDTFDTLGVQDASEHQQPTDQGQQQSSNAFWDDADADDTFETLAQNQPRHRLSEHRSSAHQLHLTEDGPAAASRTTAVEEVLREIKSNEETPKPQEDDIAAAWSAALDDDDLLDDDGFLAESDAVDTSAFFPDDDDGFLDDFNPAQPHILSPSQPMPVVDSQGTAQGFTTAGHASDQSSARYTPQQQQQSRERIPNPLTSPDFFSSARMPALAANAPATYGGYGQTPYAAAVQPPQQPSRPAGPQSSQSFVDKAKGGYASPYDLPEGIVQPRTRTARPAAAPVVQAAAPPPRSSSMAAVPPPTARNPTAASMSTPSPPPSTQSQPSHPSIASDKKDLSGGFFADLPVVPKLRSRPSGVYAPAPSMLSQAPPIRPGTVPPVMPPPTAGPPRTAASPVYGGLHQPARLPLLPDQAAAAPQALQPPQPALPASGRYSPAAPQTGAALSAPPAVAARFSPAPPSAPPAASSRYSPAPPVSQEPNQTQNTYTAAPQLSRPVQQFTPRTSSPLAYAAKPHPEVQMPPVRSVSYQPGTTSAHKPEPPSRRGSEQVDHGAPLHPVRSRSYAPPSLPEGHQHMLASPPRMTPHEQSIQGSPESRTSLPFTPEESNPLEYQISPPRRPHTQSPDAVRKAPLRALTQVERPTSAAGQPSPTIVRQQDTRQTLHPARRQFSADLSYAMPHDERAADGLERWKGSPILRWSPSGALVTSFPKQAPFYAAGHAIPTIKCTPGSVTIHDSKTTWPMDDRDAKFPGPFGLKGKGKKKEVLAWLTGKIEDLTKLHEEARLNYDTPQLSKRRVEEKVILWKMTKLFLEHDNKIEGNATAEVEARNILLPDLAQTDEPAEEVSSAATGFKTEPVNGRALTQIRKRLLEGKREDAVWYAAEQRLWSHALLIASVGGPDLWKQVVQEFVRAQVKDAGENAQSLAALYEVFAGNWDESIDELVPPSARAGFQMINKSGPSAKNPLDGLDQWRDTLGLIISNRSNNDVQAIVALGKLLSKYGRVEAAHICFLFARASAKWGGLDDAASDFVLLGADHQNHPHELTVDLDAILLSEVYEYLLSLSPAAGSSPVVPHLQAYKLHHAFTLAEHGLRAESQSYCEAIGSAVKSSTRASPYYHAGLLSSVEDLNRCLSSAPQPSSSSWIPKPSIDKVSGSMWKRFNTFVAGDDDDGASNGTGPGSEGGQAAGPFGRVSGDTPTVSRQGSVTDLYGAMAMNGSNSSPSVMGTSAPSRYAPIHAAASRVPPEHASASKYASHAGSTYSPRISLESTRPELPDRPGSSYSAYTGLQPQRRPSSTPFGAYLPQGQQTTDTQPAQQLGVPRPEAARAVSDYKVQYSQPTSRRESVQSGVSDYSPRPSVERSRYSPRPPLEHSESSFGCQPQPARTASPYQPRGGHAPAIPEYGDEGAEYSEEAEDRGYDAIPQHEFEADIPTPQYEPAQQSYQPTQSLYGPATSSYEPSTSSYGPPEASLVDEPKSQPSAYEPPSSYAPLSSYELSTTSYEPPAASFDEPFSSYEPPSSSYQPYEPEPDPEDQVVDDAPQPKKKSIMDLDDDDDDMTARAAALKAQQKRDADKAADDAFRAAAEADAERDRQQQSGGASKKGWLSGWFKKGEGNLDQASPQQGTKPIRAKLGEENSFHYDPDLKKWVNKKGGATPEASAPTPPPPRGPPSRTSTGLGAPPMSGPSGRASSTGAPPTPMMGMSSPMSGPPSGPPSRVGTPGAPMTPPGVASAVPPGLASGPPSRPPSNMSNASSIDDLLGAPAPRKSGATAKKGKRGGRYVDVMAK
ncbi:Sec23-binding domain of Sec16-domain-containing protein [Delphinella strobiligena]|nr:Sec23-binding domain of Sec16-domain-containing protein [Delphinella strobiligena]